MRVRFAPSPTGPLHIGGVRTALYNYLFARQHNGTFILRIEDTDRERFVPAAENYIIESLKWCGVVPDEGVGFGDGAFAPYRQSERKDIYKQYAEQLVKSGGAYYAFDSGSELEDLRKKMHPDGRGPLQYDASTRMSMQNSLSLPAAEVEKRITSGEKHVIRIKMPDNEEIKVTDLIRGEVIVHTSQLDDKVLFKSDSMPTYHLANVVDDYLMQITHVIRGEEWLPSAPLHILLYKYLGWENIMPQFAHLPLLLKPDGHGKLSKRDGDQLGFPVLLGWHPTEAKEIFTIEELIQSFSLDHVAKGGAKFDPEKAKWLNQQYLRNKSDNVIAEIFQKQLAEKQKEFGFTMPGFEFLEKVCRLLKEKASFVNEFWNLGKYFFIAPESFDKEIISKKWNEKTVSFFSSVKEKFLAQNNFAHDELPCWEKKKLTGG